MSKLRAVRQLTRKDKRAIKVLEQGCLRWQKLRFITLTGVGNHKVTWRKLKSFLKTVMPDLEYFGVRTAEGQTGVIHLVYAGHSVRYGDLKERWQIISGYWNVHISLVRDTRGIIREMTRQTKVIRYFRSHNWLPRPSSQSSLSGDILTRVYRETSMTFLN